MKKAVVLLSGGLDSAVTLFAAKKQGFKCFCLIFDYGQRHKKEINAAKKIAGLARCHYQLLKISFPWKGSALLDKKASVVTRSSCLSGRQAGHRVTGKIPATYVPARNIIFLSHALSYAEAIGASAIFIGAHTEDYSGYPDCRTDFFQAFRKVVISGTKSGVEKRPVKIITPLINKSKAGIIRLGYRLGVPFSSTWSCYHGGRNPCGTCDSCYFRAKGFREARISPEDKYER